jgi:hypothetical protein
MTAQLFSRITTLSCAYTALSAAAQLPEVRERNVNAEVAMI